MSQPIDPHTAVRCGVTHHQGCACHEAAWQARVDALEAKLTRLRQERDYLQALAEQDARRYEALIQDIAARDVILREVAAISDPDKDICPWGCTFNEDNCYHTAECPVIQARALLTPAPESPAREQDPPPSLE